MGDGSPLFHFPKELRTSLSGSLKNLEAVELQILEAVKGYLKLPGARWAKLKRQFTWAAWKEKDVDQLRSHLAAHKMTLQLTFTMIQRYVMQSAFRRPRVLMISIIGWKWAEHSRNRRICSWRSKKLVIYRPKMSPARRAVLGGYS